MHESKNLFTTPPPFQGRDHMEIPIQGQNNLREQYSRFHFVFMAWIQNDA